MNPTPLYNFAPLLQVMGLGLVVAAGPLSWLWLRQRQAERSERLYRLTLLTLFLTFDLVLFGSFTRLTDSGLGCPDWPGCYGEANPAAAHVQISAAQAVQPTGPVTHGKAWIEMIHRYLATAVGVLILVLAVASSADAWRRRRAQMATTSRLGPPSRAAPIAAPFSTPLWPLLTLLWVCVQGAFGALTVTMKLFPAIVTLHLLGGLVLLALLSLQAARQQAWLTTPPQKALAPQPPGPSLSGTRGMNRRVSTGGMRATLIAALVLLTVQILLGGWVSTNYAVLACDTFPTCQGSWWPTMDFDQALQIWRPLGLTTAGVPISFQALTAIHYLHRLAAYAVLAFLLLTTWRLARHPQGRTLARALGTVLLLQVITGLSNVVLSWPLLGAVLHTGGAAALVVLLVWALAHPGPLPTPQPFPTTAAPRGVSAA